jgi:glycosyltransferase involved in cell wall biosynthesis
MSPDAVAGAPRILALVAAYEEGPRVAAVVEATQAHLPVLVVDDGSTDDTAQRAEDAGAEVIRQVPNQGKGAALRAGFRRALDEGWDAVVTLDADGQHDPREIPRFLAAYGPGGVRAAGPRPELVVGRRDFRRMPPVRRLSNTLGTAVFSWAVGRHVPDNQCGYRLLGRRLMAAMLDSREAGFELEVEMIAVCLREGWTLEWVPVSTIYAGEPSHIRPLAHLRQFLRATRDARRIVRG